MTSPQSFNMWCPPELLAEVALAQLESPAPVHGLPLWRVWGRLAAVREQGHAVEPGLLAQHPRCAGQQLQLHQGAMRLQSVHCEQESVCNWVCKLIDSHGQRLAVEPGLLAQHPCCICQQLQLHQQGLGGIPACKSGGQEARRRGEVQQIELSSPQSACICMASEQWRAGRCR